MWVYTPTCDTAALISHLERLFMTHEAPVLLNASLRGWDKLKDRLAGTICSFLVIWPVRSVNANLWCSFAPKVGMHTPVWLARSSV